MKTEFYTRANMQRSQNNLVKNSIASGFPETHKMNALTSAQSTVASPIRRQMNVLCSAHSTVAPPIGVQIDVLSSAHSTVALPIRHQINVLGSTHSTVDPPIRHMNALSSAYSTVARSFKCLATRDRSCTPHNR